MMRRSHLRDNDREHDSGGRAVLLVTQLAAAVSILTFMIYLRRGDLLLYGDAVAHINIARRVFDSRTPGLLQLGTVWLPLPHLLMVPFLFSKTFWQTGIGGSIPSMLAYVLGVSGIFRLVHDAVHSYSQGDSSARVAAWIAALIYGGNPNLLYLQSTAMTEPLYLALFIWSIVHFAEFSRGENRREKYRQNSLHSSSSLLKAGLCVSGACLTRYDGWFLAGVMCVAGVVVLATPEILAKSERNVRRARADFRRFVFIAAAAPVLWLGYNAVVYRNPLEFANGPYSAKAIEQRSAQPGSPAHPGDRALNVAFSFFLKSAEVNVAPITWVQRAWVALLLLGTIMTLVFDIRLWPTLLLWVPLPFYMLSISYSGVPIFLPVWWPHSYYNIRYGLELLPAFAVFIALLTHFAVSTVMENSRKLAIGLAVLLTVAGSYVAIWREQPACFREAWINSRDRIAMETALAGSLGKLPRDSMLLMYVGDHVGALQAAGIPLSRVINEGNHRPWKKPVDPEGLWERALADPKRYVDYVVAGERDQTDLRVTKSELSSLTVIHSKGEPTVTIYWTQRPDGSSSAGD
jgi:hypothetical protein